MKKSELRQLIRETINYIDIKPFTMKASNIKEEVVNSEKEFKDYAYSVLKKAHSGHYDQEKADNVVNGLIKKHGTDWSTMVGILQNSLAEDTRIRKIIQNVLTEGKKKKQSSNSNKKKENPQSKKNTPAKPKKGKSK